VTALTALLSDRGIKTAVVIDDAFDAVPRATDLDEDAWSVFFDDLTEDEAGQLASVYPAYTSASEEELRASDEFVGVLWRERARLANAQKLFAEYERKNAQERRVLDALVTSLSALALECTAMGRDLDMEKAGLADLVFIDLFLGFSQADADMERAIERVSSLVRGRETAATLIVLMSSSSRLMQKRNEFRDKAGLLASAFRVVSKADLEKEGLLERMLTRMAECYEDTKRLAQFIQAWNSGLDAARRSFIKIVSRVDLSDLAQIRELLLEYEGDKLGDYLLDVCDGVLRHEIEANRETISAARSLNQIDLDKYPPPHLTGTADLQELVFRMTFQHSERVQLSQETGHPQMYFGDILRWKRQQDGALSEDVSLVITPACDLSRGPEQQVLLLSGSLLPLAPARWSYQASPVRTPIIILSNDERYWIKWDLKNVKAKSRKELEELLVDQAGPQRIGRLREMYALELQQKFVADFGRVGQPANPPATFPVGVDVFFPGVDGNAKRLQIASLDSSVCYVGRDAQSKPIHMLVLTEQGCDAVQEAVSALEEMNVHPSAHASLRALKKDQGFFARFRVEVPPEASGGKRTAKGTEDAAYAVVFRNGELSEGQSILPVDRKASLIVNVTDIADRKDAAGTAES
jgi:hypothetical protein